MKLIRQGDVLLVPVKTLPEGCKDVPLNNGRIVLAFGEVTGHAHAIADWEDAGRLARNAVHKSKTRARLVEAPNGQRFLEVTKPVTLSHEEHTAHKLPAGLYEIPVQMEHSAERMTRVAD